MHCGHGKGRVSVSTAAVILGGLTQSTHLHDGGGASGLSRGPGGRLGEAREHRGKAQVSNGTRPVLPNEHILAAQIPVGDTWFILACERSQG